MKSSALMVIMVLQAALVMGIFILPDMCNGDVHATSVGEGKAIDVNPGKLRCCSNCNSSFSGLYTCDDVVKICDPVCKRCAVVKKNLVKEFRCTDTFLGVCENPCKNH
ncbi:hypothetical protein ACQJBY_020669 [Aegilops geniculata]